MIFKDKIKPFIDAFVHDLKNKLTSIKFSLSLLRHPHISEEEKKFLLENTITTTDNTIEMLNDFLELERYKREKFLTNQKFDLKELIEELLEELYLDIKNKKIEVKKIFPNTPATIKTNKKWLKKALLNIMHNSIKYNKENGKLYLKIESAPRGFVLTIKDTGIGLDEIEKKKIFEKFYTKDEKQGTGIGLTMAYSVIENIGGKISLDSEKGVGTSFYIYIPKIARNIKIKRLAMALSSFVIAGFFVYDYYFCLFPQQVRKEISDNLIIYKFQNGVTAVAKKEDKLKITAKRNLFATRFKTEFFLEKSDVKINTNFQPIKVVANGTVIKNYGTEFETINNKKLLATSVYKGKIAAGEKKVLMGEGIVKKGDKLLVTSLPERVKNLNTYTFKNGNVKIYWNSSYKNFRILISSSEKFDKKPLFEYFTSQNEYTVEDIPDGLWFVGIQSEKDRLFSLFEITKILFLKTYLKAQEEFNNKNYTLAMTYVNKSLETVKNASYKPYLLKTKLLLLKKDYKNALEYAKKAYNLNKNEETSIYLATVYFYKNEYEKAVNILKNTPDSQQKYKLLGKIFYKQKDFKKAKKYLFKVLETNPEDKEAIKILLDIFKAEKNQLMIHIFENKLLKGNK